MLLLEDGWDGAGGVEAEVKGGTRPVDADGAEVEDAGGAHHDVQREQDVTVDETEAPLSHHLQNKQRYFIIPFFFLYCQSWCFVFPHFNTQMFLVKLQ